MIPRSIPQIINETLHDSMCQRIDLLLESEKMQIDEGLFFRKYFHNDAFFKLLHHNYFLTLAQKFIEKDIKPSYNFISVYDSSSSICPLHQDRPQCKYTLSVCIDQSSVWPFYLYPNLEAPLDLEDASILKKIKDNSTQYDLLPRDAVFYSGTHHPHWREKIPKSNKTNNEFCKMVFFHFVDSDFQGDLD